MSLDVMKRVWDAATSNGTDLLVMLALADRADEDGIAWPGIAYLAKKARVKERNTQVIIRRLEERGELYVEQGTGRKHTNIYLVLSGLTIEQIGRILIDRLEYTEEQAQEVCTRIAERVQSTAPINENEKGAFPRQKGAKPRIKGAKPQHERVQTPAPDPLVNPPTNPLVNPSVKRGKRAPKPPDPEKVKRNQEVEEIARTLSAVTGMDYVKNIAQLKREAKLYKTEDLAILTADYSLGGAWYLYDWRGQRGQKPGLYEIRKTFRNLAPIPVHTTNPALDPFAAARERYAQQ